MIIRTTVKCVVYPEEFHRKCTRAEHALAIRAEKDTRPYVPKASGRLVNSAVVRGNIITWNTKYARLIYFGNVYVDPKYNKAGFKYPNLGIIRSRKGVKKVAASPKRKFNLNNGEGMWFYFAKNKNLENWCRYATEVITFRG